MRLKLKTQASADNLGLFLKKEGHALPTPAKGDYGRDLLLRLARMQAIEVNFHSMLLIQLHAAGLLGDLIPESPQAVLAPSVDALRPLFPEVDWFGAAAPKVVDGWVLIDSDSLGTGGQGTTHRVRKREGNPEVRVLKTINRADDPKELERFRQEIIFAEQLSQTEHASLPRFFGSGQLDGLPYYVIEFLPSSLSVDEGFEHLGTDIQRLVSLFIPVCEALSLAHAAGIVHRDLWPPNIRLRSDGQPCIIDFGKAHGDEMPPLTSSGSEVVRGKFVAPETMKKNRPEPSAVTDVYSVGKLLYYAISGWAYDREDHRQPENNLVTLLGDTRLEYVNEILDRAVTDDPSERLESMDQLKAELVELQHKALRQHHVLRPGLPCRACSSGVYEEGEVLLTQVPVQRVVQGQADRFEYNRPCSVLVCDQCHVVELRDPTLGKWLRGKWPSKG